MDAIQAESQTALSNHINPCFTIRIVFQKCWGRTHLFLISLPVTASGEDVMKSIWHTYQKEACPLWMFNHTPLGPQKPVIQFVSISSILEHPTGCRNPSEVVVSSRKPSLELTAGFYRPKLLRRCQPFRVRYIEITTDIESNMALLVGRKANKPFFFGALILSVIVVVGIGVGVGLRVKRADIGIAASAGLFAMVTVVEALLFWGLK